MTKCRRCSGATWENQAGGEDQASLRQKTKILPHNQNIPWRTTASTAEGEGIKKENPRPLPSILLALSEESKIHHHRAELAVFEPLGDFGRREDRFVEQAQQERAVGNLQLLRTRNR